MLDATAELVKILLVPGSTSFLLLGLTAGLLLLLGPRVLRAIGVVGLLALAALYWLLSVPVVADALATRFQSRPFALLTADDLARSDAVVVLGAGVVTFSLHGHSASVPDRQTIFNAFEGARLFQVSGSKLPVVASGGVPNSDWQREPESEVIRELLVRAGVPATSVILESESRTTREQAIRLAPLVRKNGWDRVVVVAPSVQMPRVLASFAAEGISVIPDEAPFTSDIAPGVPQSRWLPSGDALTVSTRASYDYLAWLYYWMRGWLSPDPTLRPASSR